MDLLLFDRRTKVRGTKHEALNYKISDGPLILGHFLRRKNRFVVQVEIKGAATFAYLPNPGRLWEILLPGVSLLLAPSKGELPFVVMAAKRRGDWVLLHTHVVNDVVDWMIRHDLVPDLTGAKILEREVTVNKSRIDFLLERCGRKIFLEVKSCTLFGSYVAAFPDAVTARGKRHIEELALLAKDGYEVALLFLVNSLRPKFFLPDYHTDLAFSEALAENRHVVDVMPLGVRWSEEMKMGDLPAKLPVPWGLIEEEMADRGAYLSIFEVDGFREIDIGALGRVQLRPGFYVYAGSGRKNLTARINRHLRRRKVLHWHVDYLREVSESVLNLPIRTADDIECDLAASMKEIANDIISNFGCSDCRCDSHLFYFSSDPLKRSDFMDRLLYFRFDRLWDKINTRQWEECK